LNVIKLLKIYDKTKPRLEKVEAFIYVLQHITQKEAAPILTQPPGYSKMFAFQAKLVEREWLLLVADMRGRTIVWA
jgi:hypothetical protein